MSEEAKPTRWLPALLTLIPFGLATAAGAAIWLYHHREKERAAATDFAFQQSVSASSLADDVDKLCSVIGERHGGSEESSRRLEQVARMIEGTLGPSNTGLQVARTRGPAGFPILHAAIPGKNPDRPGIWLAAAYDSRPGSTGVEANATGVAAILAVARALAGDQLARPVHVVFLPHGNDPDAPIGETWLQLAEMTGKPFAILCVEAMGAGQTLWLSSRDTAAAPLQLAEGLGQIKGAEVVCLNDDSDPASLLFESGLPAIRISTRSPVAPNEPDQTAPAPRTLAASTGRLVELVRRCANAP